MTFRNFEGWTTPCPDCGHINKPDEGHVTDKDYLILRYVCAMCDKKYERRERVNQVKVAPLMNFRKPKLKWE